MNWFRGRRAGIVSIAAVPLVAVVASITSIALQAQPVDARTLLKQTLSKQTLSKQTLSKHSGPSIRATAQTVASNSRTRSVDSAVRAKEFTRADRGLQQVGDLQQTSGRVCALESIACGETVVGILDQADCDLGDGTFVDIFEFEGQAGQTIEVDMNAIDNDLDPYLLLEDPNFEIRAEDDDSGGGLDARIVHTTDSNGLWAIYANHFEPVSGDPGRYSLTLECRGAPSRPTALQASALDMESIALDWRDNSNNEDSFELEVAVGNGAFDSIGTVPAQSTGADVIGLEPDTTYRFRVRALNQSGASGYSNVSTATTDGGGNLDPCQPDANTLCLNQDRFEVTVDWAAAGGASGFGNVANAGTDDSGLFYFFDPSNWELLVKVLDACGENDHYWVFAAGTTDLQYTLSVRDTETGFVNRYDNPLGQASAAVTDTQAFATCP